MMPSSDHSACVSMPCCSRSSARSASPQGACTRAPKGESTHRRQSPISSRKRSTTIVRSRGQDAGGRLLLAQVLDERAGGALVAGVQPGQALHRALVVQRRELALQAPDGAPELERAAGLLALPERHLRGLAGRGGDDHAIALDLLDAPGRGAQQEDLALARLVHHLLVELAHAAAAVDEEDAVEAAVGDRARVRDRDALRALACAQRARRALPDDARAQLGELVRRVAPGEQVEHVLELLARELAVGIGAPDERVQRVDLQLLDRGHRDDLLAQHVERDARHARVLDLALEHAAGDGGGLHELTAEARVDAAARGHADACGRRGRRAAVRLRPSRARRPGRRGRRRPCRCRARATRWRRCTAACPP